MNYTEIREFDKDVQFEIGQRIQEARISKNMAAADLAEYMGIQRNQLSRIENGRANCTLPQLFVLAQVLECSIDFILFGKKAESEGSYTDAQNAAIANLLAAFSK